MAGPDKRLANLLQTLERDVPGRAHLRKHGLSRQNGPRGADDRVTGLSAERSCHRNQLLSGVIDGGAELPRPDPAVAEELSGYPHASHVEALRFLRLEMTAENELRAAATDVDDQTAFEVIFDGVRYPEIDQPGFLASGDDLHRVAKGLLGQGDEGGRVARASQRIGPDDAHVAALQAFEPLAEPLQAGERRFRGWPRQLVALVEAVCEPDHLFDFVENLQAPVGFLGDDEMKAVGAQVQGCKLGDVLRADRGFSHGLRRSMAVADSPGSRRCPAAERPRAR